MKLTLALVLIFCYEIVCYNYTTKYIEVPVDHFSFTNNATFKLKYLINNRFWVSDGPIFFYTGNEGSIENFADNTGFMFDIAPQFSALLVFAEHRFYGASLPFGNQSLNNPDHVGYLTSSQALADYVYLINYLQTDLPSYGYLKKVPVVAFGGSYGGMLSAWLRMKYPATVAGAIAASAPIWQFQGLTPCENFNRIVTQVYRYAISQDCSIPIKKSWAIIRNVTKTSAGKTWLSNTWTLCSPLQTGNDVDTFIDWLKNILINITMVNYPYATSFLAPLPAFPVRNLCYKLMENPNNNSTQILINLSSALQIYTNYTQTTTCNNITYTSSNIGEKAWDFQACTEIIMPICSTDQDLFENSPWNFEKYSHECFKKWGVKQTHPEFPILEYGGKDIGAASNIVFSNGLLDPWSSGGVLNNVSSSVSSIIIPEGAHHLDLRGSNMNDPASVRKARNFHVKAIRHWIKTYYKLDEHLV